MDKKFSWVPFYIELADKILGFKDDRAKLISKVKEAHSSVNKGLPKLEKDNDNIPDIDPFTVFALFNRGKQSDEARKSLCSGYKAVFSITSEIPSDFAGIPMFTFSQYCFYRYVNDPKRDNNCFGILWELFEEAIKLSNGESNDFKFAECFEKALKLSLVGISKLTMGLFQMRPNTFVNLDSVNKALIENKLKKTISIQSGSDYLDLCGQVIDFIQTSPECQTLPEFSSLAYDEKVKVKSFPENDWFPTKEEYDPKITKEQWLDFMNNSGMFNDNYKHFLSVMLDNGGQATCAQLSQKYGNTVAHYNMTAVHLAEQVAEYTNCPLRKDKDGKESYWTVLFTAKYASADESGVFIWKMRDELKEAAESMSLSDMKTALEEPQNTDVALNTILYGPPGTGKTYNTVIYAVAIIEKRTLESVSSESYTDVVERYNDYKSDGMVEFTTFHQSYGYEEFIEGIKPNLDDESENITYNIESGVFKEFCENAREKVDMKAAFDCAWEKLLNKAEQDGGEYTFTRRTNSSFTAKIDMILNKFYIERPNSQNDITKSAVYKQWTADETERERLKGKNNGTAWRYSVHESVIDELKEKFNLPEYADENTAKGNYVFIIDEINRGNISKIFGELITLIEPTKRLGREEGTKVRLPYSKKLFGVPDNVYLIGTMNTADRSIATIDTALRRRFHFEEMQPDPDVVDGVVVDGVSIKDMLIKINKRISVLYDREHTIGHAYFIPLKRNSDIETLATIFKNNIIPLLQEYFYDDYEKIRIVLGDNNKDNQEDQFILKSSDEFNEIFGNTDIGIDECVSYKINSKAFLNIEAYRQI